MIKFVFITLIESFKPITFPFLHMYSSVAIGGWLIFYFFIPSIDSILFFFAFFDFVDYLELSETLRVMILLVIFFSFISSKYIFRRFS